MNGNGNWDLSFLYESFDDPRFAADLAAVPGAIEALSALLRGDMDDRARLEQLMDAEEALSALMDRLGSFVYLTLAVDADNTAAMQYAGKLDVLGNQLSLVSSAITRFAGSIGDLEAVIASSEKLTQVAFVPVSYTHLRAHET